MGADGGGGVCVWGGGVQKCASGPLCSLACTSGADWCQAGRDRRLAVRMSVCLPHRAAENANDGFKPTCGHIEEISFRSTPEVHCTALHCTALHCTALHCCRFCFRPAAAASSAVTPCICHLTPALPSPSPHRTTPHRCGATSRSRAAARSTNSATPSSATCLPRARRGRRQSAPWSSRSRRSRSGVRARAGARGGRVWAGVRSSAFAAYPRLQRSILAVLAVPECASRLLFLAPYHCTSLNCIELS